MKLCDGVSLMIVCWLLTNSEAGADESEGDSVSDDVSQRHHHRHHHHHQQQQSSDSPVARQQWINRERKRQIRLFNIQRLIMERVGFERRPNVSSHPPMSSELLRSTMERHRLNAAIDAHLPADYLSRRVITLLPACNISESQISAHGDESDDDGGDDDDDDGGGGGGGGGGDGGGGLALTLDFNLAAIHRRPDRHTRLVAATLNLRKKLTRADNVSRWRLHRRPRQRRTDEADSHVDDVTVTPSDVTVTSRRRRSMSTSYQRRRRPSAATQPPALRVTVFSANNTGRCSARLVRAGHVGWVSLDVNSSVSDWLQSVEQDSHQLSLRVVVSDARSRAPLNTSQVFQSPNCSDHQPSLPGRDVAREPFLELVIVDVHLPQSTRTTTSHLRDD